jgi:hypothetical protein
MLEEQISKDYIEAMKAKDKDRAGALSFLRAQLKNVIINNRLDKLSDQDVITVIKKQVKQRQDSIEQFEKGGRADLVAKEKAELSILQSYLPKEMSNDQLQSFVKEAIKESGASSLKDMGNVMKVLMPKVAGQADNKRVSDAVKAALSNL